MVLRIGAEQLVGALWRANPEGDLRIGIRGETKQLSFNESLDI